MKTEKAVYSAPKAKTFEVNVQGVFCQSPYGPENQAGRGFTEGNNIINEPADF
jgi:hypothetical protein